MSNKWSAFKNYGVGAASGNKAVAIMKAWCGYDGAACNTIACDNVEGGHCEENGGLVGCTVTSGQGEWCSAS